MTAEVDTPAEVEHGTYNAFQWHGRHKVPVCEPCKQARREYVKRLRSDPEVMRRHEAMRTAERRAKSKLADAHKGEYRRYYEAELAVIYSTWTLP